MFVWLGGLSSFESWRTGRIERSVNQIEAREASNLQLAARASSALRPTATIAQLDAEAKKLSADIASREQALDIVRRGSVSASSGFAARLEALSRQDIEGIWLGRILLGSGESRLAFQGSTTDRNLLPKYLTALAQEHALDGVRFDTLSMRRALPTEAPAQIVFELGAPGLKMAALGHSK
jgi:Tfp pilus assembly protein PilN